MIGFRMGSSPLEKQVKLGTDQSLFHEKAAPMRGGTGADEDDRDEAVEEVEEAKRTSSRWGGEEEQKSRGALT